ncbi:hypothetical protein B0H13DRAFT_1920399 [Mycena leptocephala]|nr:hypothetical protein B0H13DRAFT_1920399 [Mycena leptocephala]
MAMPRQERHTMLYTILFSPTARVYNLRFLLVVTATTLVYISVGPLRVTFQSNPAIQLWLVSCAVIIVHLVISVFAWRIHGLATIDLAVLIIEIGAVGYPVYWFMGTLFGGLPIMQFLALLLSALFRFATVLESKDKFFHQRFYFLGGCTPIFIGRGEATVIIFARSVILSCVVLSATAFAIYTILVIPMFISQPYFKLLKYRENFSGIDPQQYASVAVTAFSTDLLREIYLTDDEIQAYSNGNTICPSISGHIQCPYQWEMLQTLSISVKPISDEIGAHSSNAIASNITSFTLTNSPEPIWVLQETVDATPLSGIATFARRPLSALGIVHIFQRRSLVHQWNEDFPTLHSEGGLPGSGSAGIVAFIRERLVDVGDDPQSNHESPNDLEAQTVPETLASTGGEMREANRRMLHRSPDPSFTSREPEYLLGAGYRLDDVPFPSTDADVAPAGVTNDQQTE